MSAIINEDEGHVRVLTLDRPEARNAVDPATAAALREAFEAFEKDDEARILVLTGAGGHFCAGADLEAVSSGEFSHDPLSHGPLGPPRMQVAKPMIAAVEVRHSIQRGPSSGVWIAVRPLEIMGHRL